MIFTNLKNVHIRHLLSPKTLQFLRSMSSQSLVFSNVPTGKVDAIFGLHELYIADTDKNKVNLTIGVYKTEQAQSYVFPSIRKVELDLLSKNLNMDYLPIAGNKDYLSQVLKITYGKNSKIINENRIATIQTLSGTGALSLAFDFLKKFIAKENAAVYISTPTYANHIPVLHSSGFVNTKNYAYLDTKTNLLDFDNMRADLEQAEEGSIVLLQATAHNPTGVDLTNEQWAELSKLFKSRSHIAVFDLAYQGFATGDVDEDGYSVRRFTEDGNAVVVCQSFAKIFGLYGHRTGYLSIPTESSFVKNKVESQLKILVRTSYSNPPIHGARLVEGLLKDEQLVELWKAELKAISERMQHMRRELKKALEEKGSKANWDHIVKQRGMFCYSGLRPGQMKFLRDEWHVYGLEDGRISIPSLNETNVAYVAEAINAATK